MNKIKFFLIAAVITLTTGSAMAQKAGYISVDNVVALMPETRKLDTIMQRYQADSLNPQFQYMVQEYNRKDSMVSTKDSVKYNNQVKGQIRQELEGLAYQIQNWQGIAQQMMQNKQNQLLEPLYRKVMQTINDVAKENGYAYVYTQEALLVAPPNDNLLPLVAKKLNIKLPAGAASAPAAATVPKK